LGNNYLSKRRTITATFEIVTPMFLGGADHDATRIRESSIKGALAFWWRALNYGRFVEAAGENQGAALKAMQTEEQALFGGPKGQGAFLLKVSKQPEGIIEKGKVLGSDGNEKKQQEVVGVGARYLGYGIMNTFFTKANHERGKLKVEAGELDRSCIKASKIFELEIIFKQSKLNLIETEILPALKLFGLLGGLGSRVRRGWGSVALSELKSENIDSFEKWEAASTDKNKDYTALRKDYIERLKEVIGKKLPIQSGSNWPVSAFASASRIYLGSNSKDNALDTLNELGVGFMKYRASRGNDVDASFKKDHDWFREEKDFSKNNGGRGDYIPERAAFGLPHNYSKNFGVTAVGESDRRASPLMFHVQKIGKQYYAVGIYMPTQFLPSTTKAVQVSSEGNKDYTFNPEIITDFLEGHKHVDNRSGAKPAPPTTNPYFPSTKIYR